MTFDITTNFETVKAYPHLIQHKNMPGVRFKAVLPHPYVESVTNVCLLEHYEGMFTMAKFSDLVWLGNQHIKDPQVIREFTVTHAELEKSILDQSNTVKLSDQDGSLTMYSNALYMRFPFNMHSSNGNALHLSLENALKTGVKMKVTLTRLDP